VKPEEAYDILANEVLEKELNGIRAQAGQWLAEKRQSCNVNDYVAQLEKNAVYFAETANSLSGLFALALGARGAMAGGPQAVMLRARQSAMEAVPHHLAYLAGSCSGCPVHPKHEGAYGGLLERKRGGNPTLYQEELEFTCLFFHSIAVFLQHMVFKLSESAPIAVSGKLPEDAVWSRTLTWGQMITGAR